MALGPGKYDALCTLVRKRAKARGVVVIVFDGDKGSGFSAQCDALAALALPDVLQKIVDQMRQGEKGGAA